MIALENSHLPIVSMDCTSYADSLLEAQPCPVIYNIWEDFKNQILGICYVLNNSYELVK